MAIHKKAMSLLYRITVFMKQFFFQKSFCFLINTNLYISQNQTQCWYKNFKFTKLERLNTRNATLDYA